MAAVSGEVVVGSPQPPKTPTVKPPEWLSLLHDELARIVAKILYARETSKPEKQDLDLSGPAA